MAFSNASRLCRMVVSFPVMMRISVIMSQGGQLESGGLDTLGGNLQQLTQMPLPPLQKRGIPERENYFQNSGQNLELLSNNSFPPHEGIGLSDAIVH